ncbi:MAG TPA: hypothetical protein VKT80_13145 [Chloroflexota bacterium]|nr:hypothetical protein [Chloroflexota bacterium]
MAGGLNRWVRRGLAILVCLLALVPATAGAANTTADTAQALTASANSDNSQLVGSPGGAYRYYQIAYQGSNAPVTITLTFQPGYNSTGLQGFGFNLYGPNSLALHGVPNGTTNNISNTQFTFTNAASMTLLIQVFNYTNGLGVSYTITAFGVSGGTTSVIVAKDNTAPGAAIPVTTTNASIGGTILGNGGGAFQYFTLNYPGGNAPMNISMNVTPAYTGVGTAYGFNVWRPTVPGKAASRVATGSLVLQDANSWTYATTVTAVTAGPYQLQVFNYWPGVTITYGVTTTGLGGPAPQTSGNLDSAHAVTLNSAQPGATETLNGNHGGAFNYFLVNYPGNNVNQTVSITYLDQGGAPDPALGFKVYDGATLVATIIPGDDGFGIHSGAWNFSGPDAKTYGIQAFNYSEGSVATYVIYQVGAQ